MTLKNAALLALIGTILMTALLVWTFVFNFLNLLRGLVPAVTLFQSFIYQRMQSTLFPEAHNRGAWRESKSHHPFFRSLLEQE